MESKINYDEIYLTKPQLDFKLNSNLTVEGADFLSRKIGEFGDYVVFAHKIHYKVGTIVMPYHLTTFSIYHANEYRKLNTPLDNHLHAFLPAHEMNKNHIVSFKTNTGMEIVQPAEYGRLNAEKSYFQFNAGSDNVILEDSQVHSSFKGANALDVVNKIVNKSGLFANLEIEMGLKHEIEALKNDLLYYENESQNLQNAIELQSSIDAASKVPALIFPIAYRKALSEYVNNQNIAKHSKEIEFFTEEEIMQDKNGNYKLNNKQLKELYICSLYEEKERLMGEHTLSEETFNELNDGYVKTQLKIINFSKAIEILSQNKQQEEDLEQENELSVGAGR